MISRSFISVSCILVALLLGPLAERSWAATSSWTNASGGEFNGPSNWSGGVPGAADIAFFDLDASYTVNLSSSVTNQLLEIRTGNVTLDLGGSDYTLTNADAVQVGFWAGTNDRLTVRDGRLLVDSAGDNVLIGGYSADIGTLTVTSNAQLGDGTTNPDVYVGYAGGDGTFAVNSNGAAFLQQLTVANSTGSTGSVSVTGSDAAISISLYALIGRSSIGEMTVSSGATVTTGSYISLGEFSSGSGRLVVTGTGSSASPGSIDAGYQGHGELIVSQGGEVTTNGITFGYTSTGTGLGSFSGSGTQVSATGVNVALNGTGSLEVTDNAELDVSGTLAINAPASLPVGQLDLDGGSIFVGGNFTNSGTFNFTDGLLRVVGTFTPHASSAAYSIDGAFSDDYPILDLVGNGATSNISSLTVGASHQGELRLRQNRIVNLNSSDLNIGAQAGSQGTVTVESGAEIQTTGTLAVGGQGVSSGGSGTLNISGGLVDAQSMRIYADGVVNLAGGTLAVNDFAQVDGQFNWSNGTMQLDAFSNVITPTFAAKLLGPDLILHAGQAFISPTSGQSIQISAPLVIDGGSIRAETVDNQTQLELRSGTLEGDTILYNSQVLVMSNPSSVMRGDLILNSGTLRGTGTIDGSFENTFTGQIEVTAADRLQFVGGASHTNSGLLSVIGGEVQFNNPLTNGAGTGLISARDAILRFTDVTNNGSLAFSNGTVDVYGDITQNAGGRITVSNGGIANFYDDVTISPGGANVQATALGSTISRVVFFGDYNGGVSGGGQAFIEGDHRPGSSPGHVDFGGDVFYGPFSTLNIELAGTSQGSEYDWVTAQGSAVLSGALEVSLLSGFAPMPGDTFEILTAGSLLGSFDSITLPSLPSELLWFVNQTATSLELVSTYAADFDEDGDVDDDDLTAWDGGFGSGVATHMTGDANFSATANGFDFLAWQRQRGYGGSLSGTAASIPEPSTAILLLACISEAIFHTRRPSLCPIVEQRP